MRSAVVTNQFLSTIYQQQYQLSANVYYPKSKYSLEYCQHCNFAFSELILSLYAV
uniref:Uncharacterized protein n=1 Tax=Anguilla anguilla TaxID=7936 RepID=A0A0E9P639_ANGAN